MSINKVILLGHLGKDPETKFSPTGVALCNFSLATNEYWTDREGKRQSKTDWHRVVVWGRLAEICAKNLTKGSQVYVEGQIQTRSWGEETGDKRYVTEIKAIEVRFLNKSSTQNRLQTQSGTDQAEGAVADQYFQTNNEKSDELEENELITINADYKSDEIPF